MIQNTKNASNVNTIAEISHPFITLPQSNTSLFQGWGPRI